MTIVRLANADSRATSRRARADATGTARFEKLPPGSIYVWTERAHDGVVQIDVGAGATVTRELEIPRGLDLTGTVVDGAGNPVPDALVEVAPLATLDVDPEMVATTDEAGHFDVRDVPPMCLVGARASFLAASSLTFVTGKEGNEAEVRLVVGEGGGDVEGSVVGFDGTPVAGATVLLGSGELWGIAPVQSSSPPLPALVRSDEKGRFLAVGVKAGTQPFPAHATGFAPFEGRCDVKAGASTSLRIVLTAGATVRGVVRDSAGRPADRVELSVGRWEDLFHVRTFSSPEGRFELAGLPAGEVEIDAERDELGKGSAKVRTVAGSVVDCEIVTSRGLELRGRVVDEAHVAVSDVTLDCQSSDGWFAWQQTDRDGRFTITNCPESRAFVVSVSGDGVEPTQFRDVAATGRDVEWVVRRCSPSTAHVTGLVVGPDGKPVANAAVTPVRATPTTSQAYWTTGADGRFETGAITPGTWRVEVRSSVAPVFTSTPHELAAHETWDVGTIRLVEGGRLVVDAHGDRRGVVFRVVDATETTWSHLLFDENSRGRRSDLLAPGDHRLIVSGDGVAAQTMPFAIRAGVETSLHVDLKPGVRQAIAIEIGKGFDAPSGFRLRVARDGEPVAIQYVSVVERQGRAQLCLLPGDYTATASVSGRERTASFRVGSIESSAVDLEVE